VREYLRDVFLLTVGLLVMAQLIYLIALSQGWGCFLGILALAMVWISDYRHLLNLAFKNPGVEPDDEENLPSFPG
jgi:hypothetical protein